jgi:hypothetical protein
MKRLGDIDSGSDGHDMIMSYLNLSIPGLGSESWTTRPPSVRRPAARDSKAGESGNSPKSKM